MGGEIGAELGRTDLVRGHRLHRDDRRGAPVVVVVDRRQLSDELALTSQAEHRLPAVLGRAEHLDPTAGQQQDVVRALTLGEENTSRRVPAGAAEGGQVTPIPSSSRTQIPLAGTGANVLPVV